MAKEWTDRRLSIERGWVPELDPPLGLRRLRPARRDPEEPPATLLYIHGLGESGLTLERMISDPQLAHFDHVVPDLPGYGRSAWPARAFDLHDHARALARLMDVLDLPQVVLVGHSMGGVIGLYLIEYLAGRATQRTTQASALHRLRGFLDIEGNVTLDDCGYSHRAAPSTEDDWLRQDWRTFVDRLHEEACGESEEDPSVLRAYGASIHLADPRTLRQNSRDLVDVSKADVLAERLAALTEGPLVVPHLYVHGSRGTGPRSLTRLREAGVPVRTVDGAGHWPFVDRPEVTAGLVREFVERLDQDPHD